MMMFEYLLLLSSPLSSWQSYLEQLWYISFHFSVVHEYVSWKYLYLFPLQRMDLIYIYVQVDIYDADKDDTDDDDYHGDDNDNDVEHEVVN